MHKLCKRISMGKDSGKLNFRGGKFERLGRPDETLYDLCLRGAGWPGGGGVRHAVNYDRCRSGEDVPPIALFCFSFVISY
ncbi:hypothetical protein J6590_059513 [Homalodisca vitripennis]|nr:hypothetical protein J6590_059513 [Homalodisca vitripennis]